MVTKADIIHTKVVGAILKELNKRKGFDNWLASLDDRVLHVMQQMLYLRAKQAVMDGLLEWAKENPPTQEEAQAQAESLGKNYKPGSRQARPFLHGVYHAADRRLNEPSERRKAETSIQDQPPPPPEDENKPAVWDLVIADMKERDQVGRERYGTPLQPYNGRDALVDAYQEALDLAVYLRQAIYEKDGK